MLRTYARSWSPAHLIAAYVLSLDFYWWQFKPPGAGACLERKPCLSNLLPQGTVCSIHAKHGV